MALISTIVSTIYNYVNRCHVKGNHTGQLIEQPQWASRGNSRDDSLQTADLNYSAVKPAKTDPLAKNGVLARTALL